MVGTHCCVGGGTAVFTGGTSARSISALEYTMFGTKKKNYPVARAKVCAVSETFLNPAAYFHCGSSKTSFCQKKEIWELLYYDCNVESDL